MSMHKSVKATLLASQAFRTPRVALISVIAPVAILSARSAHQPPIRPTRAQQNAATPQTPIGRAGTGPESSLSGLIDLLFRDGSTAKGHDLLESINEGRSLDTVMTFNSSIISAASSGDKKLAEKLLAEMKSENLVPGCDAYSALVKTYAKDRDWIRVYELLSEMSHCGITRDVHLFNVIIRGFVNGQDMRSAVRSFEEMLTAKQRPNVVTFNTIIEGYAAKGWQAECLEWFNKMEDSNVTPNLTSYNLLIELFAKSGDLASMLSWFGRLESTGLHPDSKTYTSLMIGYTNSPGSVSEAFTVWEDHIRTSVSTVPTTEAVNAFLRLCHEARKPERALKEWREMRTAGFVPSVANCNELIRALGSNGLISEAKAVLYDEMRRGLDGDSRPWWMPKPTWKTYVVLLDVASEHGKPTDVEEIKMTMFAHDKAVATIVIEELPHLFGPEQRT